MLTFLTMTPAELQTAKKYAQMPAHIAYRIGPASTLLRQNLLLQTRGGLLGISDRGAPVIENPENLCAAVLRECSRRNYDGVLLDFDEPPHPDRMAFATRLGKVLPESRRTLYLPETYASASQNAVFLIGTAISGGNLEQRLQEAIDARGGAQHLALDLERLRMDFRLPAKSGLGKPLSHEAFQSLLEQESPAIFFSRDLYARYFTYTRNGETHFVLFDDTETLRHKLRLGTALGFSAAFFVWPEVKDIADELFK